MPESPIPDAWPPEGVVGGSMVVPMFPLSGLFLFPRQLLPLHIFEPRYRRMIEDGLDGPGRIVIATVLEGQEDEAGPPTVLPIGGLGEIARHDKLPDGRFLIVVFGVRRVHLEEVESDRPYRRARVVPVEEVEPTPAEEERLGPRLREAVLARMEDVEELPEELPTSVATDLLSLRLQVPQPVMEEIFREPDVARRAELALAAHQSFPGT